MICRVYVRVCVCVYVYVSVRILLGWTLQLDHLYCKVSIGAGGAVASDNEHGGGGRSAFRGSSSSGLSFRRQLLARLASH